MHTYSTSWSEVVDPAFKLLGRFLVTKSPSTALKYSHCVRLVHSAVRSFFGRLETLNSRPDSLATPELLRLKLLKPKHIYYSAYLGCLGTLSVLDGHHREAIQQALMAKMALAVATKVMDNTNDQWPRTDSTAHSLGQLERAMVVGEYSPSDAGSIQAKADHSALEIASWAGQLMRSIAQRAPIGYRWYVQDVLRLIEGQLSSFEAGAGSNRSPGIMDYLGKMTERSTGSVWAAPDICFLEDSLGPLAQSIQRIGGALRTSSDLLIKACLMYDDVTDFLSDVAQGSVNAVVTMGLEKGIIGNSSSPCQPQSLLKELYRCGVVSAALEIGDAIFARCISVLREGLRPDDPVDRQGVEFSYNMIRLFNLRKLVSLGPWGLPTMLKSIRIRCSRSEFCELASKVRGPPSE